MKELYIVKLGGSALTEKARPMTLNEPTIKNAIKEIKEAGKQCIIVHGAGSFGHPLAKKHELVKGYHQFLEVSRRNAASETRYWVNYLHQRILEECKINELPCFSIPVSAALYEQKSQKLTIPKQQLLIALQNGFFPILYGDLILSEYRGFTILSGDRIMQMAAKIVLPTQYKIIKIIFASNVDGILTSERSKEGEKKLLQHVSLDEFEETMKFVHKLNVDDVTGGMKEKLLQIKSFLKLGIDTSIINLSKPNRLKSTLLGQEVIGTVFSKNPLN